MDEKKEGPRGPAADSPAALAGMGVQFLAVVLIGLFAGRWLDAKLGTAPLLLVLGVLAGGGAGMVAMYRKVFPAERPGPPDHPEPPAP